MPRLEAHVGNEQNPGPLNSLLSPKSCKHSGNWNSYYIKVTTTQIFQLMRSSEVHSAETAKFSHEPTMQLKASIRSLQTSFLLQSGITNIKQTKWQIPRSGVLFFLLSDCFFDKRIKLLCYFLHLELHYGELMCWFWSSRNKSKSCRLQTFTYTVLEAAALSQNNQTKSRWLTTDHKHWNRHQPLKTHPNLRSKMETLQHTACCSYGWSVFSLPQSGFASTSCHLTFAILSPKPSSYFTYYKKQTNQKLSTPSTWRQRRNFIRQISTKL